MKLIWKIVISIIVVIFIGVIIFIGIRYNPTNENFETNVNNRISDFENIEWRICRGPLNMISQKNQLIFLMQYFPIQNHFAFYDKQIFLK